MKSNYGISSSCPFPCGTFSKVAQNNTNACQLSLWPPDSNGHIASVFAGRCWDTNRKLSEAPCLRYSYERPQKSGFGILKKAFCSAKTSQRVASSDVSSITSFCPAVLLHQEACYKHKESRLQHTVVPYIQNEDRSNSAHLRHSLGNTSPNFLVSNDRLPRI